MDTLPAVNTPALQDKSLWLTLAALASMALARFLGLQVSADTIVEVGGLVVSIYTMASKIRSGKVAAANTAAISAQQLAAASAAQLPRESVQLPSGAHIVAVGADSIAALKAHVADIQAGAAQTAPTPTVNPS